MKLKLIVAAVAAAVFASLGCAAHAEEADYKQTVLECEGFGLPYVLNDGSERNYTKATEGGTITLTREDGISSLYVVFDRIPEQWTLTDTATGESATCGENAFLHEYVDVSALFGGSCEQLTLSFDSSVSVAEVYGFSEGELPEWVQIWQPPCEKADLLMFSSHADDEHLFFAGILPYYAVERGMTVQVAYIVSHFDTHERPHEQLDGLWTVGIRNYPIMTDFPDLYSESEDYARAVFSAYEVEFEDFVSFAAETLRRFKPLVVMTHDVNGEYGHGTHILCSKAVMEAVTNSGDAEFYPESADQYGVWQPEKTYIHLYEENPITMNWDIPLESFGGKTAFEVSRLGFDCHASQHWTWFYGWVYGKNYPVNAAADIRTYSPCNYGLYQTTVGVDTVGGDFFENVIPYAERIPPAPETVESSETTETADTTESSDTTESVQTVETTQPETSEETAETEPNAVVEEKQPEQSNILWIIAAILGVCGIGLIITVIFLKKRSER